MISTQRILRAVVLWVAVLSGCGHEHAGTTGELTAFEFSAANNPSLAADASGVIDATSISVAVLHGTDVSHLVATFATNGERVEVDGIDQISGVTPNNYASPINFDVIASDGSSTLYTVAVTVQPLSSAKEITSFSFLAVNNPGLAMDITATIQGTTITADAPVFSDISALVATFTTTGTSVEVSGLPQTSGTSRNDFSQPLTYKVIAADGSAQDYTVIVTIAPRLRAYAFLAADNPGLPRDITATISDTSISAIVPYGTDVTALIATFTTTGTSVVNGTTAQTSGTTANDFTTPVTYTVVAADGGTTDYTVTVIVDGSEVTCGETYVQAANPVNAVKFGAAVAIAGDGNTLVVGASGESSGATGVNGDEADTSAPGAGAAYVFVRSGASWVQQAYLKASSTIPHGGFGQAVAISDDGNTVAIASGYIYVFARSGTTWTQQARLQSTLADGAFFAVALSRDGSTLAGGSPLTGSLSGSVMVFERSGSTWSAQPVIGPADVVQGDEFGNAVALSGTGDFLAVGGDQTRVFSRSAWRIELAVLPVESDSVAMSAAGDEILIGAAYSGTGVAYVFTGGGATWTQQAELVASAPDSGDHFGFSAALSADGTVAVIGAPQEAGNSICTGGDALDNSTENAGAVYRFTRSAGTWTQSSYVKPATAGMNQYFGSAASVSDDGSVVAVGLPGTSIGSTAIIH